MCGFGELSDGRSNSGIDCVDTGVRMWSERAFPCIKGQLGIMSGRVLISEVKGRASFQQEQ